MKLLCVFELVARSNAGYNGLLLVYKFRDYFMLFPRRFAKLAFPILMSIYMVTIMTGLVTGVNTGLNEGFLSRWWQAFYVAWPVAFMLILVGAPRLQRLALRLTIK